jgi:cytochrome P450
MRLYSPVPLLNRQVTQDDTLGDVVLPAKTQVIVSIWSIHMNADIWGPDVDKFRPERFGPEESKRRHPWSYLPFSLGARSCVGQNLAITEAKTVLGSLLRKYSLSLPKGQKEPVTDCYVIPLRPAEPLNVILTPRK